MSWLFSAPTISLPFLKEPIRNPLNYVFGDIAKTTEKPAQKKNATQSLYMSMPMQPNNLYSSVVSINGVLYASQAMPMAPGMYSSTSSQAGVFQGRSVRGSSQNKLAEGEGTVGLRVNVTMGATTIKDIREGTSAADSMLRVGDVIAEVDGEDIEMFGAAKVWALLKGPAGSAVSVRTRAGAFVTLARDLSGEEGDAMAPGYAAPAPARAAAGRVLTPRECQVLNVPIGTVMRDKEPGASSSAASTPRGTAGPAWGGRAPSTPRAEGRLLTAQECARFGVPYGSREKVPSAPPSRAASAAEEARKLQARAKAEAEAKQAAAARQEAAARAKQQAEAAAEIRRLAENRKRAEEAAAAKAAADKAAAAAKAAADKAAADKAAAAAKAAADKAAADQAAAAAKAAADKAAAEKAAAEKAAAAAKAAADKAAAENAAANEAAAAAKAAAEKAAAERAAATKAEEEQKQKDAEERRRQEVMAAVAAAKAKKLAEKAAAEEAQPEIVAEPIDSETVTAAPDASARKKKKNKKKKAAEEPQIIPGEQMEM